MKKLQKIQTDLEREHSAAEAEFVGAKKAQKDSEKLQELSGVVVAKTMYSDFNLPEMEKEFSDFLRELHPSLYEMYQFFLFYDEYEELDDKEKVSRKQKQLFSSSQIARAGAIPKSTADRVGNLRPLDVRKVREAVEAVRTNVAEADCLFTQVSAKSSLSAD